jgi:4-carboxymuconolactone decarboxylase
MTDENTQSDMEFVSLTDDVLFGDVWEREGLSPRDRSLATIAGLIAAGNIDQLNWHIPYGIQNGLTETEVKEAITHLAFYAGWPKAVSAMNVAKSIFNNQS